MGRNRWEHSETGSRRVRGEAHQCNGNQRFQRIRGSRIREVFSHPRDSRDWEDRAQACTLGRESEKSFGPDTVLSSITLDVCLPIWLEKCLMTSSANPNIILGLEDAGPAKRPT